MRHLIAALATGLALSATAATAQTPVSYVEGGRTLFSVTVPDFWSVRTGGAREITLPDTGEARDVTRVLALQPTTDERVWMGFQSPRGISDRDAARAYLRDLAQFLTFEPTVGPTTERVIGGRPADVYSGTGRRDGRNLQFTVALIDLPTDRVAIVVAIVEAGADPDFVAVINDIFASFRAQ